MERDGIDVPILQPRRRPIIPPGISKAIARLGRVRENILTASPHRVTIRDGELEPKNPTGLATTERRRRTPNLVTSAPLRRLINRARSGIKKRNSARNVSSSRNSARSLEEMMRDT